MPRSSPEGVRHGLALSVVPASLFGRGARHEAVVGPWGKGSGGSGDRGGEGP